MKIGVDLDGVVYDFVRACQQWVVGNEPDPHHSLAIAHPTAEHWHFYEDWGYSAEEYRSMVLRGVAGDCIFRVGAPTFDAIHGLVRLKARNHTIHFVTSRDFGTLSHSHTVAWLRDWGITYDSLTFTNEKTLVDVDLFLDDHAPHVDASRAKGVKAFLLDLQRSETQGHQHLVRSWSDFVDEVDIEADRRTHPGERTDEERRTLLAGGSIGKKNPLHRFIPAFEEALTPEAAAAYAHVRGVDGPGAYFREHAGGARVKRPDAFDKALIWDDIAGGKLGEVRVVDPTTGGAKGSKGIPWSLLPWGVLRELAKHYQRGCQKYSARNWEAGYKWSLSHDSLLNHLTAFWGGDDIDHDPTVGDFPHVIAVVWHACALAYFWLKGKGTDDRPA